MSKIKVTRYGCIHYVAKCTVCDWNCGIYTEQAHTPQDVRNATRSHVMKAGHEVSIESGSSTRYGKYLQ